MRRSGVLVLVLGPLGCGDDGGGGRTPWSDQRTQVIAASRAVVEVDPASGDDCVDYAAAQDECLKPQTKCGKNGADIVLDTDGRLLDYVCYPGEATLSVEQVAAQSGDIAQRQNDSVILLDDLDDGVDIDGDLSIDANKVVVYGENPANATISGSVTVDGNNALLRGVRVGGDVTVLKNNVTLALCIIAGDLVVQGNNAQVFGCDVLGSITVTGKNAKVYGNRVGGTLSGSADCRSNLSVNDADADGIVDTGETGAPIACAP